MNIFLKTTAILSLLVTTTLAQAASPTVQAPVVAPAAPAVAPLAQQSQLTVISALARPASAKGNSAAYVTLHNNGSTDITILGATTMAANNTELHSTSDEGGVKKMITIDKLVVPAGGDLVMQKGGIHIMLFNLTADLNIGDKLTIDLITQELGTQTIDAQVVQM